MRANLFIIIVILLVFSTDAQQKSKEDKTTTVKSEPITDSVPVITEIPTSKIDSLNKKLNEKIDPILKNDNIIEKKISNYVEVNTKFTKQVIENYEKSLEQSVAKDIEIDSLRKELNQLPIDSVCVRWSFLSKHINKNCREWKIILIKP